MSYDLHIVKTEDWLEAASDPVTKREIDALVADDPDLEWTEDYVDMSDDTGEVTRYYMIAWQGVSTFLWYRDQVSCSGPSDAQAIKLVEMAERLGARVQGDDGEHYLVKIEQGRPRLVTTDQ